MQNLAMQEKLEKLECFDVRTIGTEIEPGFYELQRFAPDMDYCDAKTEAWIWSIGRDKETGRIFASTGTYYYQNPNFECLWLR